MPKMTFINKIFSIQTLQMVTLPSFVMLHPQLSEIQPLKLSVFNKTLKFQHDDVIIYDVS